MSVSKNSHDENGIVAAQRPGVGPVEDSAEARKHRRSATIQAMIMVGIGHLVARYSSYRIIGDAIFGLAIIVLVGGWFVPSVFHAIERFGNLVARAASVVASWALLAPFYYLCFVPGRIVLALSGRDPLQRKFPARKPTYWETRESPPNVDQYKSQF